MAESRGLRGTTESKQQQEEAGMVGSFTCVPFEGRDEGVLERLFVRLQSQLLGLCNKDLVQVLEPQEVAALESKLALASELVKTLRANMNERDERAWNRLVKYSTWKPAAGKPKDAQTQVGWFQNPREEHQGENEER